MPEKQKETIRELILMLMYLTFWEERDTPEMRAVKKKELEKYPLVRRCWKGYDHDLLDKLSEEGLTNAAGRTYPALITPEGEAEARKLLAQYGIDILCRYETATAYCCFNKAITMQIFIGFLHCNDADMKRLCQCPHRRNRVAGLKLTAHDHSFHLRSDLLINRFAGVTTDNDFHEAAPPVI